MAHLLSGEAVGFVWNWRVGLCAHEGMAGVVAASHEGTEPGLEHRDRGNAGPVQGLAFGNAKPDLHEGGPRRRGGREVRVKPRILGQPSPHLKGLVHGVQHGHSLVAW